nr:hypothetical protein [Nanoarchaeota archaeon]
MVKQEKAQAALEYLTTYGWAILAALIAIGALAYFGFLNPSNLLPSKCDFGRQLECVEYRITSDGNVNLMLRNNFGKDIELIDVEAIENTVLGNPFSSPLLISVGTTVEAQILLDYVKPAGDKQEVNLIITFERAGGGYPQHNISGTVFVIVQ